MNNYPTSFEDSHLNQLNFIDELYNDSCRFASPDRVSMFNGQSPYREPAPAELNHLSSRRNSFSFELEFHDINDNVANLSLKFESPKHSKTMLELNTAATMRNTTTGRKRFNFTELFTKESFESLSKLPEIKPIAEKKESKLSFEIHKLNFEPLPNIDMTKMDAEMMITNKVIPTAADNSVFELKPRKVRKMRKKRYDGCSCKNSNCLRLHCACFKELGYCKPTCRCDNCLNKAEFNKTRNFVIEKTKFIFSNAFNTHDPIEVTDVHGVTSSINPRGCNCKSGCSRNYCDCRKVNGKCSYICKCDECNNDKVELAREDIMKIYKPNSRKKHKLVINYNKTEVSSSPNLIEFQTYQNPK